MIGASLRRRQLRHVRARLRPALRVHLAQRQDRRDGPAAARRRDVDRAPARRRPRSGRPFDEEADAAMRALSRTRSSRSRWRCSRPGGCTTTASSTPATPAPCSASPCRRCTRNEVRGARRLRRVPDVAVGPPVASIRTLLVANRGEIACRIVRTAGDSASRPSPCSPTPTPMRLHVAEATSRCGCPGRRPPRPTSRRAARRRRRRTGADAIHPGYGFLAENAAFAAGGARRRAGVGRTAAGGDRRDGRQVGAKAIMRAAGVPVLERRHAERRRDRRR